MFSKGIMAGDGSKVGGEAADWEISVVKSAYKVVLPTLDGPMIATYAAPARRILKANSRLAAPF